MNGDGKVTPLDALLVINFVSRSRGTASVAEIVSGLNTPVAQWLSRQSFVDVTGDNNVTPLDALKVINELGRIRRGVASEGELAVDRVMAGGFDPAPADMAVAAMFSGTDDDETSSMLF